MDMDPEVNGESSVAGSSSERQRTSRQSTGEFDYNELPVALIATNVSECVFTDEKERAAFEELCSVYGTRVEFHYLPSFRRIRVTYNSPEEAVGARIALHSKEISGSIVNFYFSQTKILKDTNPSLELPQPVKQFLISPPASPPVGWEPVPESEPVIDYDLLAALANLAPGETHELHPAEGNKPSIVVEPCDDPISRRPVPQKIQQTKRPDLPSTSS
ncbi:calcipressin-3-like [Lytechinus variegatus]|uniref:calcipressin-3-like n=1 Tax=Lytechinus variegatus TaxID=7654 RepID=UPI001BB0EA33|nr:calcipressin-3-like [Lytechinus variegatus]